MGIWNSHTSVGNILGGLIAGAESNSLDTWFVTFNIANETTVSVSRDIQELPRDLYSDSGLSALSVFLWFDNPSRSDAMLQYCVEL